MKFFKHLHLVNKHRFLVFLHSLRLGIPFLGLIHDLSKYSPSEFITSYKNYQGNYSPLNNERKNNEGYSYVFNHHAGRNKHHYEYWVNIHRKKLIVRPMPFIYTLEYLADTIAAGKAYRGRDFKREAIKEFWDLKNENYIMHSATKKFLETIIYEYSLNGFKNLKKRELKKVYNSLHQDIHSETYDIKMD